jgi:tetratricopeptide (TPR) repeat protein
MQGDDADHEQAQRWLNSLRAGTDTEKIAARRGLARVFEQRGMREEAIELLEQNVRAGVRSGEIFRWLARLYREQGAEILSVEALTEAAKYPPASVTSEVSAPTDLPTGATPTPTRRKLALYLVALIGLGIAVGAALWLVAPLLRP